MEVMRDEVSTAEVTNNVKQSVSGIDIKDSVLEPYHIKYDYNGFYVYRSDKKILDKTGMNECLQEIYKRKMSEVNKQMTLKEFTEYSAKLSQSILDAQGLPDMKKGAQVGK